MHRLYVSEEGPVLLELKDKKHKCVRVVTVMKGTTATPIKREYARARHRPPFPSSAGRSPQVLRNSSPRVSKELGLVPPVPLMVGRGSYPENN